MKKMVLFAIGPDRPGIVSEVSRAIHQCGGNLEDSRMSTLGGDFALIVVFGADGESMGKIREGCEALESKLSIATHFKEASEPRDSATRREHMFIATGHDQPGIVSRLTEVLARNGANVISMDTSLVNMAYQGTPMFRVEGKLSLPEGADPMALRDKLEDVCEDMELLLEFDLT